ncbi:electron transport complex subunit RsxE [Fuchsiella alkaliacetigena]|uniref:electron transport complex subunit RsxE n=1 Tax=Fuchsiella alkaliacetigena TaxID=957042 RepID=UPI00200AE5D1|nr:electron transport complex subunit E [Fuchsiella alkaliacetigena]MCK8824434.1 electron transport complex subunit E [Fuchsiella alkaliacetigena]
MFKEFIKGLWEENPVWRLLLGMCPALAVTTTAINGMAMGLATTFVLIGGGVVNSLLKNIIPQKVRIPCYIVVISTFVTIVDMVLGAYFPEIHSVLGLFIPLIVVNCLILGRSEAFATHNPIHLAIIDAIGMGVGFTWGLTLLGGIREFFGFGSIFQLQILGDWFTPWVVMILPAGAFLTMGVVLGVFNNISEG